MTCNTYYQTDKRGRSGKAVQTGYRIRARAGFRGEPASGEGQHQNPSGEEGGLKGRRQNRDRTGMARRSINKYNDTKKAKGAEWE